MRLSHVGRLTPRADIRPRSQAGETLIEVLVAIILMGIGFTAVISGIYTSVRIAQQNKRFTRASIYVQAFAENVAQPAKDPAAGASPAQIDFARGLYVPCASPGTGPGTYSDAGVGAPNSYRPGSAWTAEIVKVEYFTGWSTPLPGLKAPIWSTNQAACMASPEYAQTFPRDKGMQRLTLVVKNNDADRPVTDTIVLVKRDRRCPDQYNNADLGPC